MVYFLSLLIIPGVVEMSTTNFKILQGILKATEALASATKRLDLDGIGSHIKVNVDAVTLDLAEFDDPVGHFTVGHCLLPLNRKPRVPDQPESPGSSIPYGFG
jgi:hypothetical protein